MNVSRIRAVYFSATGTTRQIVVRIAGTMAQTLGVDCETFDFEGDADVDLNQLRDSKTMQSVKCTLAQIKDAIAQTDAAFYNELYTEIEQCIDEAIRINQFLKSYDDSVSMQYCYSDSMDNLILYLRDYQTSVKSFTDMAHENAEAELA